MFDNFEPQPHHTNGHSAEGPPDWTEQPRAVSEKLAKRRKKCKLTLEKQAEICGMITVGCSLRTAADTAGCSARAVRKLADSDQAFGDRLRHAFVRQELFPLRNFLQTSQARRRAAARCRARQNPHKSANGQTEIVTPEYFEAWSAALANVMAVGVDNGAALSKLLEIFKLLFRK